MFKKFIVISIAIALLTFFILPAAVFADTNDVDDPADQTDNATYIGTTDGQYQVEDQNYGDNYESDDTADPNNGEVIDVVCIEYYEPLCGDQLYDVADNTGTENNPDNIVGELSPNDFSTDNFDGTDMEPDTPGIQSPTNTEESNMAEDAVQILATTATGASGTVEVGNILLNKDVTPEQAAVWSYTDNVHETDNGILTGERVLYDTDGTVNKIEENVTYIVEINNNQNADGTLYTDDDIDLSAINSVEITLEDGAVDTTPSAGDGQTATLVMEDPLVPGITDQNKDVLWYVLPSSYNVSFSPIMLLLETYSGDTSSDATQMSDVDVLGNDVSATDSNYAANLQDNEGVATVSYYYYPWAGAAFTTEQLAQGYSQDYSGTVPADFSESDVMAVSLAAWVDIDGDGKLDTVNPDVNYEPDLDPTSDTLTVNNDNTTINGGTVLNPIDIEENGHWEGRL